jgi:integrase
MPQRPKDAAAAAPQRRDPRNLGRSSGSFQPQVVLATVRPPRRRGCVGTSLAAGFGGQLHNDQQSEPLPHARLHDLRHVHATTLLLAGVPVHVVAARLGHADPSITLRVYAHVISDQLTEAADIFARAVATIS